MWVRRVFHESPEPFPGIVNSPAAYWGTAVFRCIPALLYNPLMGGGINPGNREKNPGEFSRGRPGSAGTRPVEKRAAAGGKKRQQPVPLGEPAPADPAGAPPGYQKNAQ